MSQTQMEGEVVREIIEQQATEESAGLDWIQITLFSVLGFTVLLILIAVFLPKIENALVYNPMTDEMLKWFAYIFMGFCAVGLVCIFWKAIRIPTGIALGVYFIIFICTLVSFKGFEKIDFMRHKHDTPTPRLCEVTKHEFSVDKRTYTDRDANGYEIRTREKTTVTYTMHLAFEGDKRKYEFEKNKALPFYDNVSLGDKAEAQCITGSHGIMYIVGLSPVNN